MREEEREAEMENAREGQGERRRRRRLWRSWMQERMQGKVGEQENTQGVHERRD